jgi:hypothetical protein
MAVKMKLPPAKPLPAIALVVPRHFITSVIFIPIICQGITGRRP